MKIRERELGTSKDLDTRETDDHRESGLELSEQKSPSFEQVEPDENSIVAGSRHQNSIAEDIADSSNSSKELAQDKCTEHANEDLRHIHPDRNRLRYPYKKELQIAQRRRNMREEALKAKEEALKERQHKREERERWRRTMAKARKPGKNGQRRLGRESSVLLEKVQKLVGKK